MTRGSTPDTGTTPHSARSGRRSRSGGSAAGELRDVPERAAYLPGGPVRSRQVHPAVRTFAWHYDHLSAAVGPLARRPSAGLVLLAANASTGSRRAVTDSGRPILAQRVAVPGSAEV